MTTGNRRHNATFLLYGETKVGKSSLAATAPGPVLVLDEEGSWNAFDGRHNPNNPGTPYRVTWWDDLTQAPPAMDDYDICVVDVHRWETVDQVINWLLMSDHPFQSVVMDSVTGIQVKCKESITNPVEGLKQQEWGALLAHMANRVKRFRSIVKDIRNPVRVMIFTAEGKQLPDGSYRPHMEGQLRNGIAYWMNTTACLRVVQVPNQDGIIAEDGPTVRRLLVKPHPMYTTGSHFEDRFESNAINSPNITEMMKIIFPGFQP